MSARRVPVISVALLVCAVSWHLYRLWPYTRIDAQDFDAIHLYFPLAQALLEKGLGFFAEEKSLQAPPFSYVYPALIGLDLHRVRVFDALLSCATLLLAARIAALAHSRTAAVIAAFLFAMSPLLRPYLAAPITEPPYLFLCAAWLWGLAEWRRSARPAFIWISAIALVLAALTRATLFYWCVLMALVYAWRAWRGPVSERAPGRVALAAYASMLLLPVAFIVKNVVLFHFGFYATGAGNALYLGNNPLTGGYDPVLLGIMYDVGSIARDQSHLTLEAERLLGGVARYILSHEDPALLLTRHLHKLGAFLFVPAVQDGASSLRAWRIGLMVFSFVGAFGVARRALRWALVGVVLYQVAVHIPVLYTHRYSVGAIDLWLVILAAIGAASLLRPERWRALIAITLLAILAIQAGRWFMEHQDPPQPDVFAAARITMWDGGARDHAVGPSGAPLELAVTHRTLEFDKSMNMVAVIDARLPRGAQCGPLHVAYRRAAEPRYGWTVERAVPADGRTHRIAVGGVPLGLYAEGTLRLDMRCASATVLRLERVAVYAPMGSIDFRERYLREKPLFPGLFER